MARVVGAVVPVSGRYAVQGAQLRAGLELWAQWARARLLIEDDESRPDRAAALFRRLAGRCDFVLGPYGSDSTRAVAKARPDTVVWNHGGAADDIQRQPGVVSVPSPASRYLVTLGRTIAAERPGASVALVIGRGRFAELARQGIERAAPSLGLTVAATFSFRESVTSVAGLRPDALLACGPVAREVELFRAVAAELPEAIVGGVSPGLSAFPELLGETPDGFLAPVQWHADLDEARPELGPRSQEFVAAAAAGGYRDPDYVAAQGYAAALIADRCIQLAPDDPLSAARSLRTTTFFGAFELDASGLQIWHRLSVIRWHRGRQELVP
jgi:ABC-type branched-subunit amino acid transport system substrate-binding protein